MATLATSGTLPLGGEQATCQKRVSQAAEYLQLCLGLHQVDLLQYLLLIGSPDKTMVVHIHEGRHQDLAVKTIHDASMARNDVSEVLDLECPFEATGEESPKGSDKRAEQ